MTRAPQTGIHNQSHLPCWAMAAALFLQVVLAQPISAESRSRDTWPLWRWPATTTGAPALFFDPAATAVNGGLEVHAQWLTSTDTTNSYTANGIAVTLPGLFCAKDDGLAPARATAAVSLAVGHNLAIGFGFSRFSVGDTIDFDPRPDGTERRLSLNYQPFETTWSLGLSTPESTTDVPVAGQLNIGVAGSPIGIPGGEIRLHAAAGRTLAQVHGLVDLIPVPDVYWRLGLTFHHRHSGIWLDAGIAADIRSQRQHGGSPYPTISAVPGVLSLQLGFPLGPTSVALIGERPHHDSRNLAGAAMTYRHSRAVARGTFSAGEVVVQAELSGDLKPMARGWFDGNRSEDSVLLRLRRLIPMPHVAEVVLYITDLNVGLATIESIRDTILALQAAGKKVTAILEGADDRTYIAAAAADKVILDSIGTLNLDGFAATHRFFTDAFAGLGVRFDAISIGTHKTGADILARRRGRPEQDEMSRKLQAAADALLGAALVYRQPRLNIPSHALAAASGKILPAVKQHAHFTAARALAWGLVDELRPDTLEAADFPTPTLETLDDVLPKRRFSHKKRLAIVPITGMLSRKRGFGWLLGSGSSRAGQITDVLDRLATDDSIAGVLLRIDSPGGEVRAAEDIWRAVTRLRNIKPVVAAFGDVAASGGYYIAAPAQAIFAHPNTVTGSIGVFALYPDLSGLLNRAEVVSETLKSGPHADWNAIDSPLDEHAIVGQRRILMQLYDAFVARVARGRNLPLERAKTLAEGRVYSGAEAAKLGLVDSVGGLHEALAELRRLTGLQAIDGIGVTTMTSGESWLAPTSALAAMTETPRMPSLQTIWGWFMEPSTTSFALLPTSTRLID